jgi:KDO2-lipid IV(A) lauroyltransferase
MADNRCAPIKDTGFHGYLEAREILRFALTHRNQKFIYIFPTDQYPYGNATKHEIGRFMNQDTMVMTGGTALACKLGMSVSYLRWRSICRGSYSVEFVPICKDASSETPEGLMRKYYDLLEKDIQDQPWNYLWSHRRWK